jgi:hypothetical protein
MRRYSDSLTAMAAKLGELATTGGRAAYPRGGMPPATVPCAKGYSFQLEG